MAIKLMPIGDMVKELYAAYKRKDGYIMSATGQNPKKWAKTSWWFTQYDKNAKQKAKALYWRENAERVWDCQGLSEGIYSTWSGTKVDVKARDNYASWCSPKGTGMIPAKKRVPGAAVFWGDDGKPATIHHVAYLYAPVKASEPEGDWYIIEARGVMYGVVMTKLGSRKPNFWGWMTKYFDYGKTTISVEVPKQEETGSTETKIIAGDYINVRHGSYYLRTGPATTYPSVHITRTGDMLEYLGAVVNGWYRVKWNGQECYVSSKCGDIVASDTGKKYVTIGNGTWYVRTEPNTKAKALGYANTGDKFETIGESSSGWVPIKYGNNNGWISTKAIAK